MSWVGIVATMSWVDIVVIVVMLLCAFIGWKRGAIKGLIQFLGLLAILVISFQFKDFIGKLLIDYMPFFNFRGAYDGLYSVNFLFYQTLAFTVIFLLLYCVLNILVNISGMTEILSKVVSVMELPNKILGAVIGLLQGLIYVFLLSFLLVTVPPTQKFAMEDGLTRKVLEQTPVLTSVFGWSIRVGELQYYKSIDYAKTKDAQTIDVEIIQNLVSCDVVEASLIQKQIDNGKLHLYNVTIASAG